MSNPYTPPRARVSDPVENWVQNAKTPWLRALAFYWALAWRTVIIVALLLLVFMFFYGLAQILLDQWPLLERIVRLICVIGLLVLGSCLAIVWASQSSFGGYGLRACKGVEFQGEPDPSHAASPVTLGCAVKLFWAHFWRYALISVPIGMLQSWLGMNVELTSSWGKIVAASCFSLVFTLVVGTWAIREALHRPYRGFHFQWLPQSARAGERESSTPTA